jgi:hypothetical protein
MKTEPPALDTLCATHATNSTKKWAPKLPFDAHNIPKHLMTMDYYPSNQSAEQSSHQNTTFSPDELKSVPCINESRFIEDGNSVFFPNVRLCLHKSFVRRFIGVRTASRARQVMKKHFTHSQKDEIIHYLKQKNIIYENG